MKDDFYFDIIILSTQRSGSTMICDDMRNVGNLGLPEEYFIPAGNISEDRQACRTFIASVIKKSQDSPTGIKSIKIMANQLDIVNRLYTRAEIYSDEKSNRYLFLKKARYVIYCYRSNLVKQAISRLMARKTGICHRLKSSSTDTFAGSSCFIEEDYNRGVQVLPQEVLSEATRIFDENQFILNVLKQIDVNPIISSYESYIEKPRCILDIALKLRNIKVNSDEICKKRTLKKMPTKQSNSIYKCTISSYNEKQISNLIQWFPENFSDIN